jgi:hypothetical protein
MGGARASVFDVSRGASCAGREAHWQRQLGKKQFADLKAALKELSGVS